MQRPHCSLSSCLRDDFVVAVVAGEAGSVVLPRRAFDFVALAEPRHLDKSSRCLLAQVSTIPHLPCRKMY